MGDGIIYVGLDVHKDAIVLAVAEGGLRGEVREYGRIANTPNALDRLARKLGGAGARLRFCYEAGPCGYNAATLIAELGDLSRFANPRQLMAYLGLLRSEHSSGASVRRGDLTKAGNGAARRLLIEAAWCYRFPARVSRELLLRQEALPKAIREIAWKAQTRFCARYRRLAGHVVTAIARELAGFVWAVARQVTIPG